MFSTPSVPFGAADFNAYGSCRPPRIGLAGSVWTPSGLRLGSVWAPSGLRLETIWRPPVNRMAPKTWIFRGFGELFWSPFWCLFGACLGPAFGPIPVCVLRSGGGWGGGGGWVGGGRGVSIHCL